MKNSQYLKYALGEITLVVIGILIALSINNWNEKRKTQQRTDELTEKLKMELGQIVEYCDGSIDGIQEQIDFLNLLLQNQIDTDDSLSYYVNFDLSILFYISSFSRFYDPPSDIYQAAISDGDIRLISDTSLTNTLHNFHRSSIERVNQFIDEEYALGREINDYLSKEYSSIFEARLIDTDGRWDRNILKKIVQIAEKDGTLRYKISERLEIKNIRKKLILSQKEWIENLLKSYQ